MARRSRVARDLELDQNREWIVGVESVLEGAVVDGPTTVILFCRSSTRAWLHRVDRLTTASRLISVWRLRCSI
jgi:hypothetical protein